MCSKFGQSALFTLELLASIAEKTIFDLLGMLDSGERLLPFWRLVFFLSELSPFLELCPFDKIRMKSCQEDISKS